MAQARIENSGDFLLNLKARAVKKPSNAYSVKWAPFLTIVTRKSASFKFGKRNAMALTMKPDWRFESSAGEALKMKIIVAIINDGYQTLKNLPSVFNCISIL